MTPARKRKFRSSVWQFFTSSGGEGAERTSANCNICGKVILTRSGTTSGLQRHLEYTHNHKKKGGGSKLGELGREVRKPVELNRNEKRVEQLVKREYADASSSPASTTSSKQTDHPKTKSWRQRNSPVWKFFVAADHRTTARCKICNAVIKTSGGTTSGISRHLLGKHQDYDGELGKVRQELLGNRNSKTESDISWNESNDSTSKAQIRPGSPMQFIGNDADTFDEEEMSVGDVDDDNEEENPDPLVDENLEEAEKRTEKQKAICFICDLKLDHSSLPQLNQEEYRFLFMELLEIPTRKSLNYLEQLEAPEDWILLCQTCINLVGNGLSTRKKIISLQCQLENCKSKILKTFKSNKIKMDIAKSPDRPRQVLEGIKEFVHSREYPVLSNYGDNDNHYSDYGNPGEPSKKRDEILYCGLCGDDKPYRSAALLTAHTRRCHQSPQFPCPRRISSIVSRSTSSRGKSFGSGKKIIHIRKLLGRPIAKKLAPCKSYRYDCPNCPEVKGYSVTKYILHLSIHQKMPYQCVVCFEFLPPDEIPREHHWQEKHSDIHHPPDTDRFVQIKFHPGRIWKCGSCLEGFFSEDERDKHELNCLPPASIPLMKRKPHQCSSCEHKFRNIPEWRLHRALQHPEVDSMSCYFCDRSFCEKTVEGMDARNDKKLVEHMFSEHHTMRLFHACEYCGMVFDTGNDRKKHLVEQHKIPGNEVYSCTICGIHLSAVLSFRRHMSIVHFESEMSNCDNCGKKFLEREGLLHHQFLYHGVVPVGSEVLKCPEEGCTYSAVSSRRVDHHFVTVHENGRTRPFVCKFCGKGFKQSGAVNRHEEIHRNKESRPYQCETCGSSFTLQMYLEIHQKGVHGQGGSAKAT